MHKFMLVTSLALCLMPQLTLAQEVDWSTSFLFRTTGGFGFENPMFRVAFDPKDYPPDPVMPTLVDLNEPTVITLTIPDIAVTEGAARILFAVEEEFTLNAEGTPEDGIFSFETVGQGVQNFEMTMRTGSGGIPIPGSWEAFNPQPEPPAAFQGMAFDFQFSSNSPATLEIRALDDGVESFSFELVEPADLTGDGFVDGRDLGILLGNWGENVDPAGGELDNIAPVDGLDLGILLGAWNPPLTKVAAAQPVPEPGACVLAVVSLAMLLLCKRERSSHATLQHSA